MLRVDLGPWEPQRGICWGDGSVESWGGLCPCGRLWVTFCPRSGLRLVLIFGLRWIVNPSLWDPGLIPAL